MEQTLAPETDQLEQSMMKITISRKDLASALAIPAFVSPLRAVNPVFSTILFEAKEGVLRLVGWDNDMWAESKTNAAIEHDGSVCLQARLLNEIVAQLSESQVEIVQTGSTVKIHCGNSDYDMLALPAEDFQDIPAEQGDDEIELTAGEFRNCTQKVEYAVANDISRPVLGGIQVAYDGKDLNMVATDTHRLSVCRVSKSGLGSELSAVIPAKTMAAIKQLPLEDDDKLSIHFDENRLYVTAGPSRIVGQQLEGAYPNWQRVVPTETTRTWSMDREELVENIRRAMILARDNSNRIRLACDGNMVTISSESREKGKGKEQVPCVAENGELEIAFNGKYVLDALSVMDSESIQMEMTDAARPAIIRPSEGGESEYCVVMPMSLN